MFLVLASFPLMVLVFGFYLYPSYSEGKQMVTGAGLYSNQEPKLR